MDELLAAIVDDDRLLVRNLLRRDATLGTRGVAEAKLYEAKVAHWLYPGDTALHLAAAGHRAEIVGLLLAAGAEPNAGTSHRRGRPLHYAADGVVTGPAWDEKRQVKTIRRLLAAGADVNSRDANGATALHRAVRTRCAAAVTALLDAGSEPTLRNNSGSTPFHLAVQDTGRGGTGAAAARAAQQRIIEEFLARRLSPKLQDGKGKAVLAGARSAWIRDLLSAGSR
jgi:ankyrin repeat protein